MTREDYLQRVGQLVDGMILAGDASFKYAKVIRLKSAGESTTSKPVQGIFTILNEYEQASMFIFIHDPSFRFLTSCASLGHGRLPKVLITVARPILAGGVSEGDEDFVRA